MKLDSTQILWYVLLVSKSMFSLFKIEVLDVSNLTLEFWCDVVVIGTNCH